VCEKRFESKMDASMTATLADTTARDPQQIAQNEAMLTKAFADWFTRNPMPPRDQFMTVGRAFHQLAGELGLRNRIRAFSGAQNVEQMVHIAAVLLEAAKIQTRMSLTQLEPIVASAVEKAHADQQRGADLDATCVGLAEFDGAASPDARDPQLRIVELEDALYDQAIVIRELSTDNKGLEERLVRLESALTQRMLDYSAPSEEPADNALQVAIRETRERLERFIVHVDATDAPGQIAQLRQETAELIASQTSKLKAADSPALIDEVKAALDRIRRRYDEKLAALRQEASDSTAVAVQGVTSALHAEFSGALDHQVAMLRIEMENRLADAQRKSGQPAGASPATRERIATVEQMQQQAASRAVMANSEIRTVRTEIDDMRAEMRRSIEQIASTMRTNASQPAGPTRDELKGMLQAMTRSIRDEMMTEMRLTLSQSLPRDAQQSAPRMTFGSAISDTTDVLARSQLEHRRAQHPRAESKGDWIADFIADDDDLRRVFSKVSVKYSWLKTHAFFAAMVPTLRIVGRTLVKLESQSADDLVEAYFKHMKDRGYDLTVDEHNNLVTLRDAARASDESMMRFIEEVALRLDRDTKVADRPELLRMLLTARLAPLSKLTGAELDKVLTGERIVQEIGDLGMRMVARKKGKSGFQ
jgi:sugar-specific transcriptional regulator TrmB